VLLCSTAHNIFFFSIAACSSGISVHYLLESYPILKYLYTDAERENDRWEESRKHCGAAATGSGNAMGTINSIVFAYDSAYY